jgi:RNA polymerase sigma factor (sigma-70 family)
MQSSDAELLDDYVRQKSDAAFAELVRRYVNLVHGSATRQLINHHLADDVTQAVFIVLARKAGKIRGDHLAGWLLKTTRFCVADARKKIGRRNFHEEQAAAMKMAMTQNSDSSCEEIFQHLDEALGCLPPRQSTAISMRYLQNKSCADVAAAMGVSRDAAQKILARALPKLRRILAARGLILSSTAGLAEAMIAASHHSVAANFVIAPSAASSTGWNIAQKAMRIIFWNQAKLVSTVAVAGAIAGTGTVVLVNHYDSHAAAAEASVNTTPNTSLDTFAQASSMRPFASPFLELETCRIKRRMELTLAKRAEMKGQRQASVHAYEMEFLEIDWSVDPSIAAETARYRSSIATPDDDGMINSPVTQISKGSSPEFRTTAPMPATGDYYVQIQALDRDGKIISESSAPLIVKPLIQTDIEFCDIQPDGTLRFYAVMQRRNNTDTPITEDDFTNSPDFHITGFMDTRGLPIPYTKRLDIHGERYFLKLNPPVLPGQVEILSGSVETKKAMAKKLGNDEWEYSNDHSGSEDPMRRLDLLRLPPGAEFISTTTPKLQRKIVDGQTQLFLETEIAGNGKSSISFRYRLQDSSDKAR